MSQSSRSPSSLQHEKLLVLDQQRVSSLLVKSHIMLMSRIAALHTHITLHSEAQTCSWRLKEGTCYTSFVSHMKLDEYEIWITVNTDLDSLESGGIIARILFEDVSRSKAKGAQAVQDGSLEAWRGAFQNTQRWVKIKIRTHRFGERHPSDHMLQHLKCTLTSHGGEAGVYVERVPVSTQTVQGRLQPPGKQTLFRSISNSWTPELLIHRRGMKLNYHEGNRRDT